MSESNNDSTGNSARPDTHGSSKALTVQVTPHTKIDANRSSSADDPKEAAGRAEERVTQSTDEIGVSSQPAPGKVNQQAGKVSEATADKVGRLTSEAVKVTAAGARATWRFTLMALQWVIWTVLALLLAALAVSASGALAISDTPRILFWTGVALFGTAVALHFPPLFFRLPRGWKKLPYIGLLPAVIGGLVCFFLAIQTFESPSTSLIQRQDQGSDTYVVSSEQTEGLTTSTPASASPIPPSDLNLEEVTAKYGSGKDFNVGRFCLDEEAAGGMTFDECLGAAVVALGAN